MSGRVRARVAAAALVAALLAACDNGAVSAAAQRRRRPRAMGHRCAQLRHLGWPDGRPDLNGTWAHAGGVVFGLEFVSPERLARRLGVRVRLRIDAGG